MLDFLSNLFFRRQFLKLFLKLFQSLFSSFVSIQFFLHHFNNFVKILVLQQCLPIEQVSSEIIVSSLDLRIFLTEHQAVVLPGYPPYYLVDSHGHQIVRYVIHVAKTLNDGLEVSAGYVDTLSQTVFCFVKDISKLRCFV